jgi:hypothetical protein
MRHDPSIWDVWNEVGDDIYKKMANFGLGDRDPYYKAIIDCALNKGDKGDEVDTSNLAMRQIPRCFFDLPAVFVEQVHDSSLGINIGSGYDYRKGTPIS